MELSHQAILKGVHPMRAHTPSLPRLLCISERAVPRAGEKRPRIDSILGEEKQALVLAVAAVCCNGC